MLRAVNCALSVAFTPPPLCSPNCSGVMLETPSVSMPVITATNMMALYTIAVCVCGGGGDGGEVVVGWAGGGVGGTLRWWTVL